MPGPRDKMKVVNMFITAVCFIFLIKLRWPKTKSFYGLSVLMVLVFYYKDRKGINAKSTAILGFFFVTQTQPRSRVFSLPPSQGKDSGYGVDPD